MKAGVLLFTGILGFITEFVACVAVSMLLQALKYINWKSSFNGWNYKSEIFIYGIIGILQIQLK